MVVSGYRDLRWGITSDFFWEIIIKNCHKTMIFWTKQFKKNYLLIKYEDLILDPHKEFNKLAEYLSKLKANAYQNQSSKNNLFITADTIVISNNKGCCLIIT